MSDIDEPIHYRKRQQNQHQKKRFDSSNVSVASAAAAALLATATGVAGSSTNVDGSTEQGALTQIEDKKNLLEEKITTESNLSQKVSLWDEQLTTSTKMLADNKFLEVQLSESKIFYLNVPQNSYYAQSAPVTPQSNSRGPSPSVCSAPSPVSPIVLDKILGKRRSENSSSPLLMFSRELKELRKKSISEISLILEMIRGATSPEQSSKTNVGNRMTSLSAGNLLSPSVSTKELNNFSSISASLSPGISKISSFIRQKRNNTKIRWQQRLSPNNIQKQMGIGKILLKSFFLNFY